MERANGSPRSAWALKRAARLADSIEPYLVDDRRRALATGAPMPERVNGSALFADISGFTPLTEAFAAELGPRRGAEEITATLDLVFNAVLAQLHRHGGSVISFSGDAVTCWLDGDDGLRAVACALDMQRAMSSVDTVTTPAGTRVQLGMKVAVAAGTARRFVVGDPEIQLIDALAGSLMDRVAGAEHLAERGDVVVDASTLQGIEPHLELSARRGTGGEGVGVVKSVTGAVPDLAPLAPHPRLPTSVLRQWVLPSVFERLQAGRGEFLSELRPAVPMFVRFGGIDYDLDPDARELLDGFVRRAQRIIHGFGGNLLQMTIGDKGAYLYAVFGAPLAHEDDAARACGAALDLLALDGGGAVRGLQIGITDGRMRSGAYGDRHRRTFTCIGDTVNLAARLMSAAPAGQAYVTAELARAAEGGFLFEELPDLQVKGKASPVAARRLVARSRLSPRREPRPGRQLFGRARELAALLEVAERARGGSGRVVALVAEAGLGKSRLVEELVGLLDRDGVPSFSGAATSVGTASYRVWEGIWARLFGVGGDDDPLASLERALRGVDAGLVARLPLLSAILPISVPDNELTRSFDAKLRKSSLESLLLAWFTARAARGPLVLVLEDCHWIDELSSDLLEVLARAVARLPVLMVLTYRPGSFAAPELAYTTVFELANLDEASSRQVVADRLADLYGPGTTAPDLLVKRLVERAEGNPFYLEELVNFLHSEGADLPREAAAASVELPASLASLVLSRIDTLAEPPRQTLKVASVVGREFGARVLSGTYPDLGPRRRVTENLRQLCRATLVLAENVAADAYAFKHAVIWEVTYESLPFSLRASLHGRVGAWLEQADPQALEALAHHYWNSADEDKKRHYLLLAGEAAQARYANDAAVEHFRRAAPLLAEHQRGEVLLKLGAVLELRGEWSEAESVFFQALELAERLADPVAAANARTASADVTRKQGRFDEAVSELEAARRGFDAVGDLAGLGRVAHLRGTIAAQRGDYLEARAQYERSLDIRRQLEDGPAEASLVSNLAIVAEYEQDYDRAEELNLLALELRSRLGDRWGIGVSENNLGMIAYLRGDHLAARSRLEEALRIELGVGDLWMVAIARHNLGNATRELDDVAAARSHYGEALRTYGLTGDRWAQCLLFEDIAMLVVSGQPHAALRLVGAAEAVREAIGSPRVAAQQAELDERLAPARERLKDEASAEHAFGRALGADDALALALVLVEEEGPDRSRET